MPSSDIFSTDVMQMFKNVFLGKDINPPIDIEAIARSLGAKLEYEPILHDGSLEQLAPKKFLIRVKKNVSRRRQRYTIAHEVAHIIFSLAKQSEIRSLVEESLIQEGIAFDEFDEERICNYVAAFLLVPSSVAKQLASWESFTIERIEKASKIWQVSLEVLLRRILALMPSGGGFAWGKPVSKQNDPNSYSLRLDWRIFPKSYKIYFPKKIWLYASDFSSIDDIAGKDERFYSKVKLDFDVASYCAMRVKAFGKDQQKRILIVVYPKEPLSETVHCLKGQKQTILSGRHLQS